MTIPIRFNPIPQSLNTDHDTTITHQAPVNNMAKQADGVNQAIANKQADSAAQTKNYAIWTSEQHVSVTAKVEKLGNGKVQTTITYNDID